MKRIIFSIPMLLFVVFMLTGCESNTTVTSETGGESFNGRVIGTLHGIITTQDTNTPMAGVRLLYAVEGSNRETVSDTNGFYRIDNLTESTYTISFISPDSNYVDWGEVVAVHFDSAHANPSDVDYHVVISRNIIMFRRNAGVSGYVYARLDNETTIPASGVEVKATGFGGVLNADFSTTTNSSGHYMFSDLPATPAMTVLAMPWTHNSITFGAGAVGVNLIPGASVIADNITVRPATADIVVLSNNFENDDFPVDGTLNLVFNRPIDDGSLVVSFTRSGMDVPFVSSLGPNMITLTIDPAVILRAWTRYTLWIQGRGTDYTDFTYAPTPFWTERGIELESTNLWREEDVGLNETLTFTFTKAIDVDNPNNRMWVERSNADILMNWSYSEDNLTLSCTPVGSYIQDTDYTIGYLLYSVLPENFTTWEPSFHTLADLTPPSQVTGLALDEDVEVDWDTRQIWLSWDAIADVASAGGHYEIYGYDTYHVTDRVLLARFRADQVFGTERRMVSLPSEFDWLPGDPWQTPFTNNIEVRFMVRATNNAGNGPLSTELSVGDNTPPIISNIIQYGSANNSFSSEETIVECRFGSDIEYCAATIPTWEFVEAGGDPNYLLPHDAASWEWDDDMRNGTLTITVPPNSNGAGDELLIWGVTDLSGNVQADSTGRVLY